MGAFSALTQTLLPALSLAKPPRCSSSMVLESRAWPGTSRSFQLRTSEACIERNLHVNISSGVLHHKQSIDWKLLVPTPLSH